MNSGNSGRLGLHAHLFVAVVRDHEYDLVSVEKVESVTVLEMISILKNVSVENVRTGQNGPHIVVVVPAAMVEFSTEVEDV